MFAKLRGGERQWTDHASSSQMIMFTLPTWYYPSTYDSYTCFKPISQARLHKTKAHASLRLIKKPISIVRGLASSLKKCWTAIHFSCSTDASSQ
ncbi:hypothetical protein OG21DRAFT_1316143 [Imleria badia]|nr:hypothetical protein OG21DRAFT_1316143 [Imleria badia]